MRRSMIIPILVALMTMSACVRQNLEEILYTKAIFPVIIDWETRALMYVDDDPDKDLYSASLWLFPTKNSAYQGDPIEYKLGNPEYGYIEVPIGEYNVLVFNKTIDDYSDRVGFRGTDQFDTFEYFVNPTPVASLFDSSNSVTGDCLDYPDLLAAWTFDDGVTFKVTFEEISRYETVVEHRSILSTTKSSTKVTADDFSDLSEELLQLTHIVPERLVHNVTIHECVKNLHSANKAYAKLTGMSTSVLLASREYSKDITSHSVELTEREYFNEYQKDGAICGTFNAIGPLEEPAYYSVESLFTLITEYDESIYYPTPPSYAYYFDVTRQVEDQEIELDKHIDIYICYNWGDPGDPDDPDEPDDPTPGSDPVPDPEPEIDLPDLIITEDSGFDVNVNEWGEEVVIPM